MIQIIIICCYNILGNTTLFSILFIYLCICLFVCLFVCLSICLYVCMYVCLSVYLSIYLFIIAQLVRSSSNNNRLVQYIHFPDSENSERYVKLARMTPVASGMRSVAVAPLLATGLTTPLIIDADYYNMLMFGEAEKAIIT